MRIAIIGGGASGVCCAIHARETGNNEVILLEKNDRLLKKLLLTGNGRCNFMHDEYRIEDYHSQNIVDVEDFISEKNINDVRYFFDSIGVVSKSKNGYVYPVTNQASTVRDALIRKVEEMGISIVYNAVVEDIEAKEDQFIIHMVDRDLYCDKVVLATGSFAYPKTGSDGVGYSILERLGHRVVKPLPALVQLKSDFLYADEWDGVRCDVILSLEEDGETIATEEGEAQLTDYGISGICTFNLSHFVTRGLEAGRNEVIKINFVPFIETLIPSWMERYSKKNPTKNIYELLEGFLNKKIVPIILKVSHIREDVSYEDLNNDEKITLCKYLKEFPIHITGTKDFDSAQVCNGGLLLGDLDMDTMESRIIPGLYIIGELLDINGNCGGFNLTTCWISGILAGRSLGDTNDFSETN